MKKYSSFKFPQKIFLFILALSPAFHFACTGSDVVPGAVEGWAELASPTALTARYRHTAVRAGSKMYVWGGDIGMQLSGHEATIGNGAIYDTTTSTWTVIPEDPAILARQRHSAVVSGLSRMYIWGGDQGYLADPMVDPLLNDGGILNLSTGVWSHIPDTLPGTPSARHSHVAYLTAAGNMLIWGGETGTDDGGNPVTDGAIYTPDATGIAGTWQPMVSDPTHTDFTEVISPSNGLALEARSSFSSVWTGTQLIVWGGINGVELKNDGAVYDLATDTWSAMSVTGAPSARQNAKAIWTGSRMIVWGGYGGSVPTFLNDGGIYNPTTNTWSSISTTNAPSVRRDHTIVWAGTRMIVWGGKNGSTTLASGAIYNPDNDTWTTMLLPTENVPIALVASRERHTAVWMGSTMIICHGINLTVIGDCGIYTPDGDDIPIPP